MSADQTSTRPGPRTWDQRLTLQPLAGGVALTHQALSPKHNGGWQTMWWAGPDPAHPGCATWTGDETAAAVYPTETAAVAAFEELGRAEYQMPPAQLQIADGEALPAAPGLSPL